MIFNCTFAELTRDDWSSSFFDFEHELFPVELANPSIFSCFNVGDFDVELNEIEDSGTLSLFELSSCVIDESLGGEVELAETSVC